MCFFFFCKTQYKHLNSTPEYSPYNHTHTYLNLSPWRTCVLCNSYLWAVPGLTKFKRENQLIWNIPLEWYNYVGQPHRWWHRAQLSMPHTLKSSYKQNHGLGYYKSSLEINATELYGLFGTHDSKNVGIFFLKVGIGKQKIGVARNHRVQSFIPVGSNHSKFL